MPPNPSYANYQRPVKLHCDAATCDTTIDRDSIMTRSPSPNGDTSVSEDIRVVIEKFSIPAPEPEQTAPNRRPTGLTSKISQMKKKSGVFKSFRRSKENGVSSSAASICPSTGDASSVRQGELARLLAEADKSAHGGEDDVSDFDSSVGDADNVDGFVAQDREPIELPRRWLPKGGRSQRSFRKTSGLLSSFTQKGIHNKAAYMNHSSHPPAGNDQLKNLREEENREDEIRRNSDHDGELSELIQANSTDSMCPSTADVSRMLRQADSDISSAVSEDSSFVCDDGNSVLDNELDVQGGNRQDSWAMLESLGDNPSSKELANVAAARAKEYIEECLSADVSMLNRTRWESIPQYSKADLLVRQHLGKGTFSDAFEVICTVAEEEKDQPRTRNWNEDKQDLDSLIEAKFKNNRRPSYISEGEDELDVLKGQDEVDEEMDAMLRKQGGGDSTKESESVLNSRTNGAQGSILPIIASEGQGADLDKQIDAMFGKGEEEERDDLDQEIDAMFGPPSNGSLKIAPARAASQDELDIEIDAMFGKGEEEEGDDLDQEIDVMFGKGEEDEGDDLDKEIDAMFGKGEEEEGDDLDKEIDAMFGKGEEEEGDDLDKEIDAMFGSPSSGGPKFVPPKFDSEARDLDKEIEAMFGTSENSSPTVTNGKTVPNKQDEFQPRTIQPRRNRRSTVDLGKSVCLGTQARKPIKKQTRKLVLAMKCLRPQIRSNSDQFMIGVEDLVHETAMLASLDHPNIVKLHGRARGCLSNSFRLSDGYFILLDRLKDTLTDRIVRWKKSGGKGVPPAMTQIKTASCIADALSYLHSKRIAFRDLKPDNVGFDSMGVLKLFDFGFAVGVDEPPRSPSECSDEEEETHLLYDKCGTPRYMAPEVGLGTGYDMSADVYSFGILLWEICALKKPFRNIRSAAEFNKSVFEKGTRPKLSKHWPAVLQDLMTTCWSGYPAERPEMPNVKTLLAAHAQELSQQRQDVNMRSSFMKSLTFRRFTQ